MGPGSLIPDWRPGLEGHAKTRSGIEMRPFEPDDADACYAVVERNRDYLRPWLPWVDHTHSAEDIRNFIENTAMPKFEAGNGLDCGLWMGGEFVGSVGCHAIDWAGRNCSLGYWLDAAHQGKGVITGCCASMLDYLFDELLLHRVTIECATGNARSAAIPQRLGFTREGIRREAQLVGGRWLDLAMWSMLAAEWQGT